MCKTIDGKKYREKKVPIDLLKSRDTVQVGNTTYNLSLI